MNDLSLKGIARKYDEITGDFSVVEDIFDLSRIEGTVSLRSRLESMAREEHSFDVSECIYDWRAAFQQTWTHIRVRIDLDPDAAITNATMNALRPTWQNGIQTTWGHQWGCGRSGELTCPLTFEVQWVGANPHHTVRVRQAPPGVNRRSLMTLWDTNDTGATAAHEFGHMLGHPDEYPDRNCPDRDPTNTGTVMDNKSANVAARLVTRFADNIGSDVVAI